MFRKISSKLFIFLILLLSSLIIGVKVQANGTDGTQKDPDDFADIMELEFLEEVQNPQTQEFEFTLRLQSLLNTNRVRVSWEIANGLAKIVEDSTSDAVTVEKNQNLYVRKRFRPLGDGIEKIRVRVTIFDTKGDYFSYIDKEFLIRESLEIAPNNSDYKNSKFLLKVSDVVEKILIASILALILLNVGYRFRKWMSSD